MWGQSNIDEKIRIYDDNPAGKVMTKHIFATIIYAIEDTLGLWSGTRKNEQINKFHFDKHREYYRGVDLPESSHDKYESKIGVLFRRLHHGCNVPSVMMDNHFDILESVFNCLARESTLFESLADNAKDFYIEKALLPLICVDIFTFCQGADETSIYFHLDRILRKDTLLKVDNEYEVLNKHTAQKHIQDYIDLLFQSEGLSNKEFIIPHILTYLDDFYKKKNQTCRHLNKLIDECISKLSGNERDKLTLILGSISAAYTAIIILQNINYKTNKFSYFYKYYNTLIDGDRNATSLLCNYKNALSDNYSGIAELATSFNYSNYPFIDRKDSNVQEIIEKINYYLASVVFNYPVGIIDDLLACREELEALSVMVTLPPQFTIPMEVINGHRGDNFYEDILKSEYAYVFNKELYHHLPRLANKVVNGYKQLYNGECQIKQFANQYIPLIRALDCIQRSDAVTALEIVKDVSRVEINLFGFVKHALAILNVGLMYKLKRDKIRHDYLLPQLNDIINHQGIISIPIQDSIVFEHSSWLSKDDYYAHSIIMPGVTNSYILSQTIYCYNFTIARHTVAKCDINVNGLGIHSVNLLQLNYSSPLIIHDLLERLNFISGKILKFITSVNLAPTPELFAHELFKNKIIDVEELTDNLIHCVPGSSLGVCLLDYLKIILFFSVPGDNVENIIELGKNTRVVELLFRAYKYHKN